jgi:cytochrome c551/c552
MLRKFMFAGLLAAGFQMPALSKPAVPFTSVKVELPSTDAVFPGGEQARAINNNCLACHSAEMVLYQPSLTKAAWSAEVQKMIKIYKAPVQPQDTDAIIAYLVQYKGKQ